MSRRISDANPGASTATLYVPGCKNGKVKVPLVVLTVLAVTKMAVLVAVTFAPATAAPLETVTCPTTVAVYVMPVATQQRRTVGIWSASLQRVDIPISSFLIIF